MRKLVAYTAVILLAVAAYSAWILYSRWNANRSAERAAQEKQAEADRKVVESVGGDSLKILSFYPLPAMVRSGEKALICYGVSNAKTVRIEPHIDDLTPSLSRCLEVFPKKTTEYKLSAEDGAGHSATQSFVIQVK